jgi:hypothetical protein
MTNHTPFIGALPPFFHFISVQIVQTKDLDTVAGREGETADRLSGAVPACLYSGGDAEWWWSSSSPPLYPQLLHLKLVFFFLLSTTCIRVASSLFDLLRPRQSFF